MEVVVVGSAGTVSGLLHLDQFPEGKGPGWSEGGTAEGKGYAGQVMVKSSTWT